MGSLQSSLLGELTATKVEDGGELPVQRGSHFCLVDEADSILIDEARTPLIIGSIGDKAIEKIVATYRWAAEVAPQFVDDEHYEYDHDDKKVELTATGRQMVRIMPKPAALTTMGLV